MVLTIFVGFQKSTPEVIRLQELMDGLGSIIFNKISNLRLTKDFWALDDHENILDKSKLDRDENRMAMCCSNSL